MWREKRGSSIPVHSLAGSGGARTSHSIPGLPETGQGVQSARCRTHCGSLQVSSTERCKHICGISSQAWQAKILNEDYKLVPPSMECALTLQGESNLLTEEL